MYKGELEDFPKEVVDKMLHHQVQQGHPRNIKIFEEDNFANRDLGGFDWSLTVEYDEDDNFWNEVINKRNFDLFFSVYPKKRIDSLEIF